MSLASMIIGTTWCLVGSALIFLMASRIWFTYDAGHLKCFDSSMGCSRWAVLIGVGYSAYQACNVFFSTLLAMPVHIAVPLHASVCLLVLKLACCGIWSGAASLVAWVKHKFYGRSTSSDELGSILRS